MEEDVDYVNDYVKAVVSLQRQTDRRQNKSTSGENRIAAAAAIALQTMQDLSGTPAHNIVQNFPRLEDAYITSSAGAATQPRGCWIMPFLGRSQERESKERTARHRQRPAKITLHCNENSDEGLGTNRRQLTVYCNMELLDALQQWFRPATMKSHDERAGKALSEI
jgi:hypothetical protein